MSIDRRHLMIAAVAAAAITSGSAKACTLLATRNDRFSDSACRHSLREFLELLNEGRSLSDSERAARVDGLSISIDDAVLWDELGDQARTLESQYLFFANYLMGGGRLDPKPAKLTEMNLLKSGRGHAIYQFTVRRHQYHPADDVGCNGLLTHGEFYGDVDRSYLGIFRNNMLHTVRQFEEWLFDN